MTTPWQAAAACRDRDPELFFPLPHDHRGRDEAKKVCQRCPVRVACLMDALTSETRDRFGIRGGFSENERRGLQQKRARGEDVTTVPVVLRVNPQRRRAPADPIGGGRTAFGKPEYLAPAGVLVAADGIVTLTDETWARVEPFLQRHFDERFAACPQNGRTYAASRVTEVHRGHVCGLLHRYGHGAGWRQLPEQYGPWPTLRKLQQRLIDADRWRELLDTVGVARAALAA